MYLITDALSLKNWQSWDPIAPQEFPAQVCFGEKDIRRLYVTLVYQTINENIFFVGVIVENKLYSIKEIGLPEDHSDDNPTYRIGNTSDVNVWLEAD